MKKFFKSYTYTWQEVGIFKWTMIFLGIIVGAYWHEFFSEYLLVFLVLWVIGSVYILYISLKQ